MAGPAQALIARMELIEGYDCVDFQTSRDFFVNLSTVKNLPPPRAGYFGTEGVAYMDF
jgi:hypothetical protein